MATIGDIFLRILSDDKGFEANVVKSGQKAGDKAGKSLGDRLKAALSPKNLAVAGVAAAGAGLAVFAAGIGQAVRDLIRIEQIGAQTNAVIRSTGGVANVSRGQVDGLAQSLEKLTGIEAESITEGQNLLLTFTNIRNQAGEGNDIFNQATEAIVDYSVAMGTDASTAAIQLGKALNDPVKGLTALGKAGVQFSDAQKDMIKELVAAGDLMGAQKIILSELETQFGGSAEAFGNTTAGKIAKFQNDIGNMFESIVLGAIKVGEVLSEDPFEQFAMNFGEQGDRVHALVERFGGDFDDLKARIEKRMDETGESFTEATNHIEGEMANASVEVRREAGEMMTGVGDAISAGAVVVEEEFERIAAMPSGALQDEYNNIRNAAYQSMVEYAKGVMAGQNEPQVAFDAAMQLMEDEMTKAEEIANLKGKLVTLEHAQGVASAEGKVATVNAINATISLITGRLDDLTDGMWSYGYNIPYTIAQGMNAGAGLVVDPARQLAGGIRAPIGIESEPEDHSSPLYGITKWGGNIGQQLADDMLAKRRTLGAAAASLAAVIFDNLGIGRSGLALGAALLPGTGGTVGPAAGGDAVGGDITNINLNVEGREPIVSTAHDIAEQAARLGRFGKRRG